MDWPSASSLGVLLALTAPLTLASARQRSPVEQEGQHSSDEISFLVVDRGGKPLPEAEVRIAVEDEEPGSIRDERGGWRRAFRLDHAPASSLVDELLERHAVVRPDATGVLRCSWPRERGLLVEARHGELWGFRWFARDWRETTGRPHPEGRPLRLELVPDWPLDVRAQDEAGRSLDAARVRLSWERWSRELSGRGELHIAHIGHDLRKGGGPLFVELDALLFPPVRATLDPRRRPTEPVVLRRPASGSVRVHVLEPDGRPSRTTDWIMLELVRDPVPESSRRFEISVSPPRSRVLAVNGSVQVDGVSLGGELTISLEDGVGGAGAKIEGPALAGDIVEVSLRKGPPVTYPRCYRQPRVIEPEPSGRLEGFVLLDPAIPPDELDVRIQLRAYYGWNIVTGLGRDGKFALWGLPPGPSNLEVVARAAREVVSTLELEIVPGTVTDPRLAAIDLRGKVFSHAIALSGLDPERDFHARVFFLPAGAWTPTPRYLHVWDLPLVIVAPWDAIDADIFVPGHRRVSLRGLSARAEVELEPALPVRLVLKTDGTLPAPPRLLKAVLVPAATPYIGFDWEGPAFGRDRTISTFAWSPGLMQVRWIIAEHAEDSSHGGGASPEVHPLQFVDVLDTPREQVFEVSISAKELARILAE